MNQKHIVLTLVLCLTLVGSFGCKKGGLKGLVQLSGTVTLDGEPVEGATVMFAPETKDENSRSATAVTQADGSFVAMTLQPGDGVFPGTYKISVSKMTEARSAAEVLGKKSATSVEDKGNEETMSDAEAAQMSYLKDEVEELMPAQYISPFTSGLSVTVDKSGVKDFKIELKK